MVRPSVAAVVVAVLAGCAHRPPTQASCAIRPDWQAGRRPLVVLQDGGLGSDYAGRTIVLYDGGEFLVRTADGLRGTRLQSPEVAQLVQGLEVPRLGALEREYLTELSSHAPETFLVWREGERLRSVHVYGRLQKETTREPIWPPYEHEVKAAPPAFLTAVERLRGSGWVLDARPISPEVVRVRFYGGSPSPRPGLEAERWPTVWPDFVSAGGQRPSVRQVQFEGMSHPSTEYVPGQILLDGSCLDAARNLQESLRTPSGLWRSVSIAGTEYSLASVTPELPSEDDWTAVLGEDG